MNKRLKELAMIAADNWNLTFEDHKFLEKFAELITKENISDIRALALAAYVAKSKKTEDTNERWQASVEAVLKEVRIDVHWQASVEAVLEVRGSVNNPFEFNAQCAPKLDLQSNPSRPAMPVGWRDRPAE